MPSPGPRSWCFFPMTSPIPSWSVAGDWQSRFGKWRHNMLVSRRSTRANGCPALTSRRQRLSRPLRDARTDVRSSFYLEDPATEFDIQGLELDWVGVCWDADFRRVEGRWDCRDFQGSRW